MSLFHRPKPLTVNRSGATAGAVLCGISASNEGLRVQVQQDQVRGNEGAIQGRFVILDVGTNMHSDVLLSVLQRPTDAAEVLAMIRKHRSSCINVVNANILVRETPVPVEANGK